MATMDVRGHKQEAAKPSLHCSKAQQVHWAQKARERGGEGTPQTARGPGSTPSTTCLLHRAVRRLCECSWVVSITSRFPWPQYICSDMCIFCGVAWLLNMTWNIFVPPLVSCPQGLGHQDRSPHQHYHGRSRREAAQACTAVEGCTCLDQGHAHGCHQRRRAGLHRIIPSVIPLRLRPSPRGPGW